MGPIGLGTPLRFKTFDSQPEKSNMGPVSPNFHDFVNETEQTANCNLSETCCTIVTEVMHVQSMI